MIVKTNKENYYASILNFFNGYYKFTDLEIKIMGAFLYHYKKADPAPDSIRWKYAFSTETRKEIRESLEMSTNVFNTTLHKIKNRIIPSLNSPAIIANKDGFEIHKNLLFPDNLTLKVKFEIEEPKEEVSNETTTPPETTAGNRENSQQIQSLQGNSGEDVEIPVSILPPESE